MEPKTTLDQINDETKVNDTISRDEENAGANVAGMIQMAEQLIRQLPADHPGRNEWLERYGTSPGNTDDTRTAGR